MMERSRVLNTEVKETRILITALGIDVHVARRSERFSGGIVERNLGHWDSRGALRNSGKVSKSPVHLSAAFEEPENTQRRRRRRRRRQRYHRPIGWQHATGTTWDLGRVIIEKRTPGVPKRNGGGRSVPYLVASLFGAFRFGVSRSSPWPSALRLRTPPPPPPRRRPTRTPRRRPTLFPWPHHKCTFRHSAAAAETGGTPSSGGRRRGIFGSSLGASSSSSLARRSAAPRRPTKIGADPGKGKHNAPLLFTSRLSFKRSLSLDLSLERILFGMVFIRWKLLPIFSTVSWLHLFESHSQPTFI